MIHQTYDGYVPPEVEENIAKYSPQYTRRLYRDEDCIAFPFLDQYTTIPRRSSFALKKWALSLLCNPVHAYMHILRGTTHLRRVPRLDDCAHHLLQVTVGLPALLKGFREGISVDAGNVEVNQGQHAVVA